MEQLERLRPAGLLERYHIARCELGFDSSVIASARYISRAGVSLDKTRLHHALSKIIVKHPALATQIVTDASGTPQLVRLRSVDVERAVEGPFPPSLQGLFAHFLARPFDIGGSEPLWRVGHCDDGTVAFVYNHAIGDGQSAIAFHAALLDALNAPPPPSLVVDLPPPLLPAVEALTDTTVSWPKLLRELYGIFAPPSWKAGAQAWTGNPVVAQPTLRTHIAFWELGAADAAALLDLCRRRHCTLTAFLCVLAEEALSHTLATRAPEVLESYKDLSTSVAVSLRRFTGTPPTALCDQSSKFHRYAPIAATVVERGVFVPESFPWDRALAFGAALHAGLAAVRQDIGALAYLFGHFEGYFAGMLGRKREGTLTISNIGRFPPEWADAARGAEWSIGSMFFGQCDATAGPAMKLNVVGAPNGCLGTTFTWGEGAVDEDIAQAFIETVKTWTAQIIAGIPVRHF